MTKNWYNINSRTEQALQHVVCANETASLANSKCKFSCIEVNNIIESPKLCSTHCSISLIFTNL